MSTNKILGIFSDLQKALPEFEPDADNPYFDSKFISLSAIMAKLKPILDELGVLLIQTPTFVEVGDKPVPALQTMFVMKDDHEEFLDATMLLNPKASDPQAQGSALTYARRYMLLTMLNIVPVETDDDGQSAEDVPITKMMNEKDLIEVGNMLREKGVTSRADRIRAIQIFAGTKALNTSAVNRLKKAIGEVTPDVLADIIMTGEIG